MSEGFEYLLSCCVCDHLPWYQYIYVLLLVVEAIHLAVAICLIKHRYWFDIADTNAHCVALLVRLLTEVELILDRVG